MDAPLTSHPAYRAYVIDPKGGILIAHALICQTDEEAISKAKEYANGNAVELWDRGRKIAFIPLGGAHCVVF
ncbi:hypothetical protein [Microvirga mediterraneensis]|uniref:DUF5678 domain-containing protein n=1 Tax=Microvirga mediterraneensis TaxID=2754695 RepID=A0A838BTQ6_9HYPH|nr:hypothetical protein [Microvirga mediterraneensis]MBA1158811.1 hypothetical protein [Microvirga mediterraneensis]